jgi:hypothetical protein
LKWNEESKEIKESTPVVSDRKFEQVVSEILEEPHRNFEEAKIAKPEYRSFEIDYLEMSFDFGQ